MIKKRDTFTYKLFNHNILLFTDLPAKSFKIPITPKIVRILGTRSELQCGISSKEEKIYKERTKLAYRKTKNQ